MLECRVTKNKNAFGQTENTPEHQTEQKLTTHKNKKLARINFIII